MPVPRPSLDLCLPTGVTIGAGSRIVVMPDEGGVVDVLGAKLAEAGADVLTLKRTATVAALETQLAKWTESGSDRRCVLAARPRSRGARHQALDRRLAAMRCTSA